jgi:hypothetical protein
MPTSPRDGRLGSFLLTWPYNADPLMCPVDAIHSDPEKRTELIEFPTSKRGFSPLKCA